MTSIQLDPLLTILCPHCSSPMRITDPSLLGRRGRCWQCGHKFLLEDPDSSLSGSDAQIGSAPTAAPEKSNAESWACDDHDELRSPSRTNGDSRGTPSRVESQSLVPELPTTEMACPYCHASSPSQYSVPFGEGCLCCGAQFATSQRADLKEEIRWTTSNGTMIMRQWQSGPFGLILHGIDVNRNLPISARRVAADRWVPSIAKQSLSALHHVSRLSHPQIAPLTEIHTHQDDLFLIGPEIQGVSLAELMIRQQLSPRQVASLGISLANALDAAHHAGIVHRDLKPANIILAADTDPIILGFGLPRRKTGWQILEGPEGVVIGTLGYLAPEQAMGNGPIDLRSDVYSLGVVLFQALTGKLPFQGTPKQILNQILTVPCPPPSTLRPDLPWEWDVICKRCLAKEPKERYQNAKEMLGDLEPFQSE